MTLHALNLKSFLLLLLFISYSINAQESKNKLTIGQTALGEKFRCAHDTLNKAYNALNYQLNYFTFPSRRSLKESNSGSIDGELIRVEGVELLHPNLIQVPVPICYVDSILLASSPINITSFIELKNYRVGITLGYIDHERITQKYNLNVTRVSKNDTLEDLLMKGRVDIIFSNSEKLETLKKLYPNFQFVPIKALDREISLYHYLHKKHQALIPLLTQELQKITKNQPKINYLEVLKNQ